MRTRWRLDSVVQRRLDGVKDLVDGVQQKATKSENLVSWVIGGGQRTKSEPGILGVPPKPDVGILGGPPKVDDVWLDSHLRRTGISLPQIRRFVAEGSPTRTVFVHLGLDEGIFLLAVVWQRRGLD